MDVRDTWLMLVHLLEEGLFEKIEVQLLALIAK